MKATQLLTITEPMNTPVRVRSEEDLPLHQWLTLEQHRWKTTGHCLDTVVLATVDDSGQTFNTLALVDIEPGEKFNLKDPFVVSEKALQEIEAGKNFPLNNELRIRL